MKIAQSAGRVSIEGWTEGYPLFVNLCIGEDTDRYLHRISLNDLHDLRYCVDRVLAQVGQYAAARR